MKTKVKEATSAQVAETSKKAKGATPAKSTTKESGKKVSSKKVIKKTEEAVAEKIKERTLLYNYPASVAEGKTEGERQRRKKGFRQEMRGKIKSMLKNYKAAKADKANPKNAKDARTALKAFVKENLTQDGVKKFKLGFLFEKVVPVS